MDVVKYFIRVDIHQVKDVLFKEPETEEDLVPNVFVTVNVGPIKQSTVIRNKASSSVFNSSFNFSIDLSQAEFQRSRIIVTLYHKYTIQSGKIGHHAFSLPLIYSKQQHCIHRSWVRVFDPLFPTHNAGSLLTSICVSAPGDKPPIFKDNDELSGQGLGADLSQTGIKFNKVPEISMKNYMLYLNVVCGRDFEPQESLISSSIGPYVKLSHFGMEESTDIIKDCRDPEWQKTLYLPCITPSYDELVTVEIWNRGPTGETLLHFESIDLMHLINNEYPPRWINIYCQHVLDMVKNIVVGEDNSLTDYGGRVLISASADQVQTLYVKGSKPCRSISVPPIQQRIISVDLYEIVSLDQTPNIVRVEINHGPFSTKSANYQIKQNGSYKISDRTGRLNKIQPTFSSNDDSDVWDLFVYVFDVTDWGRENNERIAWARIPYEKAKMSEGKPMWILLSSFKDKHSDLFNILISFEVTSNVSNYERKKRLEYTLTKYKFRSMLYEALHLPCKGNNEYPSSWVEIELGGHIIKSKVVKNSINPYFFEAKELEIPLPANLLLAPDININVYAVSSEFFSDKKLLCSGQYSLTKVPKEWKKAPQWIKLKSSINSLHRPKILVSFELIPFEDYVKCPEHFSFFDDIVPTTIPCFLSLLLIGIRTFKPLENPIVDIKFTDYSSTFQSDPRIYGYNKNQNKEDDNSKNVVGRTGKPIGGCYGNWNYLTSHEISFELPKRMQHHSCLEFQIRCDNYTGVFGTTFLTLNQFLPWLKNHERTTSVELFKMQCMDDFNSVEQPQNETSRVEKKSEEIKNINIQMLEKIDLVSIYKSKFSEGPSNMEPISSSVSTNDGSNEPILQDGSKQDSNDDSNKENLSDYGGGKSGKGTGSSKGTGKSKESEKLEDELDFDILIDDNINEMIRDELPYEMESEFDCEDLPYMKAPIIKFTQTGIPEVIGTIKFILTITENPKNRPLSKPPKQLKSIRERFENQKKMLNDLYRQAKDLVVRSYILEAKGLYSSSIVSGSAGNFIPNLSGDVFTYIWIRNVDEINDNSGNYVISAGHSNYDRVMGYPNSIKDSSNLKKGLKPVFNSCYNIGCSLPENSILKISVVCKGTLTEEIIGTTYIDCEDRFFNKNLQKLMLDDCAPIESRGLKVYGSGSAGSTEGGEVTISHGVLRLWIEMMDLQTAKMKPIQNLGSLEPSNYELRVVIWKAKYFSDENSTVSLFVRGVYQNESSEKILDTDIHYHSKDKTGTFNWRFKFPITIPTEYTNLKLQLYSYSIIKNELLGEANVDLVSEFHKVRKKNNIHNISKFTASCYGPQNSNKVVGSIDIEISILNESDSKRYLVGLGREAPNRDPFLPAVLENRTLVDWQGMRETISSASTKILSGLKITGVFISVAAAFAVFLLLLIIFK